MTDILGTAHESSLQTAESLFQIAEHIVTILGVAFVALQLFMQTRQQQQSNYLAVMQARTDITEREIAHPWLTAVYDMSLSYPRVESLKDWNELTPERKSLYLHLGTLISQQERAITLLSRWPADRESLVSEEVALRELAALPIFKSVWPYMKTFYGERIVRFVDSIG